MEHDQLDQRLRQMETQIRRWKLGTISMMATVLASLAIGATQQPQDLKVNKLTAKEIHVTADGNPDRGILLADDQDNTTIVLVSKNSLSSVMIMAAKVNGENIANVAAVSSKAGGEVMGGANISSRDRTGIVSSFNSDGTKQIVTFDSSKR